MFCYSLGLSQFAWVTGVRLNQPLPNRLSCVFFSNISKLPSHTSILIADYLPPPSNISNVHSQYTSLLLGDYRHHHHIVLKSIETNTYIHPCVHTEFEMTALTPFPIIYRIFLQELPRNTCFIGATKKVWRKLFSNTTLAPCRFCFKINSP